MVRSLALQPAGPRYFWHLRCCIGARTWPAQPGSRYREADSDHGKEIFPNPDRVPQLHQHADPQLSNTVAWIGLGPGEQLARSTKYSVRFEAILLKVE